MSWSAALMFTAGGFGLAAILVVWACEYFSVERMEMREIKRLRKKRLKAARFLRSTARRDVYNEFEGSRPRG